jgi:hypothetical protein
VIRVFRLDGTDGVGIVSTIDNGNGTFTINYSDGSSFTTIDLTGPQGPPGSGSSWQITNVEYNGNGNLVITTDEPDTYTTTQAAWLLTGNAGTNVTNNFIGTTDNMSWAIRTNNAERIRVTNTGLVGIGTTTPGFPLDVNGKTRIYTSGADMGTANIGQLEIFGLNATDHPYISFHKPGVWGAHFGIDSDNWFSTRGWSAGPAGYTNLKAGILASYGQFSFFFHQGQTDGTNNVVMRWDGTFNYIYPWGAPNPTSTVMFGGGAITNVRVNGRLGSFGGGTHLDGSGWTPTFSNNDGNLFKAQDVPAADKPIFIQRFSCSGCDNPNRNTGVSGTDYVAVLAGFFPTNNTSTDTRSTRARVYLNTSTNTWWFNGDLQNPSNETWDVDIMFIRRYLVNDIRPNAATGGGTGF